MAGYGGVEETFDSITVTGGNVPFSSLNVSAPGIGHNDFSFGGITGQVLTITLIDSNLAESAGLDNLSFSEVPEPASALSLAAAFAAASVARRRRV